MIKQNKLNHSVFCCKNFLRRRFVHLQLGHQSCDYKTNKRIKNKKKDENTFCVRGDFVILTAPKEGETENKVTERGETNSG